MEPSQLLIQGWPICDVCKKPVEEIVRWEDFDSRAIIFKAICHGEEEVTPLQDIDIYCAKSIRFTRAFVKKEIENDQEQGRKMVCLERDRKEPGETRRLFNQGGSGSETQTGGVS